MRNIHLPIISTTKLFLLIFSYLVICISTLSRNFSEFWIVALCIFIILDNLYLLYLYWNQFQLRLVSLVILYCNYSIIVANFALRLNNLFTSFTRNSDPVVFSGLRILLLFSMVLVFGANKKNPEKRLVFFQKGNRNDMISIGMFIVLVIILIYGFSRPDTMDERGSPSTIFEYSTILFILGYYYTGGKKGFLLIYDLIIFAFIAENLIYGGRVSALQFLLIIFLIVISPQNYTKVFFVGGAVGFLVFSGIGMYRTGFVLSIGILETVIRKILSVWGVLDTAYSAFYTSLTFVKYKEMTTIIQQIADLNLFLASMVTGGSILPQASLSHLTRQYFLHYFGGVLPFYFYYYLGYLGVVLIGIYVSFLLERIVGNSRKDSLLQISLPIYLCSTSFRWYLYSPSNLFRGILLLYLVMMILKYFNRFSNMNSTIPR